MHMQKKNNALYKSERRAILFALSLQTKKPPALNQPGFLVLGLILISLLNTIDIVSTLFKSAGEF